jgi:predicted DNA-binding transcriptional regulator YafY
MPHPHPSPRWSVERRLDFIAARLTWEGRINRQDLVARFGVSPNQATADLKLFESLRPGALVYDTRAKTYRAGPGLPPPDAPAAEDLLRELRLIAEGVESPEEGVLSARPPAETAEPPARPVPPDILAVVITAIRERRAFWADYQSFSAPQPRRRRLEPHALVFDGFRWHARARDADEDRFRDFVLGRLSRPELDDPAMAPADADREWWERVELVIAPHPGLEPHQRAAIERDYGMTDGRLVLWPRAAVAWYVRRRLGLTDGHEARPSRDQHIILLSENAE